MNESLKKIEERLAEPTPPPPAALADRIKGEIPAISPPARSAPPARRQAWLLAASVTVALAAGLLVYRTGRQVELMSPVAEEEIAEGRLDQIAATERSTDDLDSRVGDRGRDVLVDAPRPSAISAAAPVGKAASGPATETPAPSPGAAQERQGSAAEQRNEPAESASASRPDREQRFRDQAKTAAPTRDSRLEVDVTRPAPEITALGSIAGDDRSLEPMAKPMARRILPFPEAPAPPGVAPPSTGGTTEPNDQPYGDMFFDGYGVNPFVDTEDDRFSTFGLDVDSGSWSVVRRYLEEGHLPPPDAVRVEEMLNSFDYRDPAPRRGDFAVRVDAGPAPFADGPRYRLVRFGIRARQVSDADRLPATLIFVVDVSGSMNRENRLGLVKRSLSLLLDRLRRDDRVGLVVYGSTGAVLLEPTGDLEAIRSAVERLTAGGSTNAEEGLVLAYELAARYQREEGITRVILCSDGVANVGRTGPGSILERIGREAAGGVELTTVGFGMGNYNDVLMEQLADRGDGRYAYVDDLDEARRIFVENLTGTLQTIAADAKAQVEFNPAAVSRYRLLGYENRDVADDRFRDDTVDAGEIGAGHAVTALYEIKLVEGVKRRARLATLHLRWRSLAAGEVIETSHDLRASDLAPSWETSPPQLQLAAVVAEFGEILRHSFWAKQGNLDDLFARAQKLSARFEGDLAIAELATLIGKAARLSD